MRYRRGFSLSELLIILAIITVIAGVFFPVFYSVRAQAYQTMCLSNFKQALRAHSLYRTDYDDRMVVSSHIARRGMAPLDTKWPQLVSPYARSFRIFKCPADHNPRPDSEFIFDSDLDGSANSDQKFAMASARTNLGYNAAYLAPSIRELDYGWRTVSRSETEVRDPSTTIMLADSVWRVVKNEPSGGGNYLITPPCRYLLDGNARSDSFGSFSHKETVVTAHERGWSYYDRNDSNWGGPWGGIWPWHRGRASVGFVDGHARAMSVSQISEGCVVKSDWGGLITDSGAYNWDIN